MNRQRNFGFLLKAVARLCSKNFERHASELGLGLSQCKVLVYLSRSEGVSQTRLAELTETDPMTLVRILDRMEADQWVQRRPDPADRRAHCLHLNNDAKPVLASILKLSDQARDEALAGLDMAEREHFMTLLERVHTNLSAFDMSDKPASTARRKGE